MRVVPLRAERCERARQWVSLALDGELSELEHALLDAHVGQCEDCRAFQEETASSTHLLRTAGLAELRAPIALPRRVRRTPVRTVQVGIAAAVAVAAIGLGSVVSSTRAPRGTSYPSASAASMRDDRFRELKDIRRDQLQPQVPVLEIVQRGLLPVGSF